MVSKKRPTHSYMNFDGLLLETINNILSNVFGENGKRIILETVERRYSLRWMEIPEKPQVFADALGEILGSGSVIIEDLILETFYSKLGLEFRWREGYKFSDYINELKKSSQRR